MRAGTLRRTVDIVSVTFVSNSKGGATETETTIVTAWPCRMRQVSGRERVAGQQLQAVVTHEFCGRYVAGVLPKQRVKLGTRKFEIKTVTNPAERDRELELLCEEKL